MIMMVVTTQSVSDDKLKNLESITLKAENNSEKELLSYIYRCINQRGVGVLHTIVGSLVVNK